MSTADLVARCEPSVALIRGRAGSGTGFLVRPGVLATNAHVIKGGSIRALEVRFPSAEGPKQGPFKARLLYQDKTRDLAFLAVETDLPALSIAESYTFRKGEDVTVIGNPGIGAELVLENAISRGVVSSKTQLNGQEFLQLGISINPGNSGGPVFDSTGRVIGVVTLKTTKQEGLAFCVPVKDLSTALAVAESRRGVLLAERDEETSSEEPATRPGAAPTLKYRWKSGETYVYQFDVSIDVGSQVVSLQGSSIYQTKSVDDDEFTLRHRNWLVKRTRSKDGRMGSGGINGPTGGGNGVELKLDSKGNVIAAVGSSPLPLLGDLSLLMIEPFPDEAEASWEASQPMTLNEVEQVEGGAVAGGLRFGRPDLGHFAAGRLGSRFDPRFGVGARSRLAGGMRSRFGPIPPRPFPFPPAPPQPQPQTKVKSYPAHEQSIYALRPAQGGKVPITKTYELVSEENVGNEPRFKMTGQGTLQFDVDAGVPVALDFHAEVVEHIQNVTIRAPITVTCRLLSGEERTAALRSPVMPPTMLNPLEEAGLRRTLAELKSKDDNRRRTACRTLYEAAPLKESRKEVSRALEQLLAARDPGLRSDAIRALGVWGDSQTVAVLLKRLGDESFGARNELFEALGRLEPSEETAEAVARWLVKEPDQASRVLRAIGPVAEKPLLRLLENEADPKTKSEACRVLRDVGGAESVPALEALARLKEDGELGRLAGEAVKAIVRRYPSDGEWAAIVQDTKSPDGNRRREAIQRLIAIEPVEAHRGEVARALESVASDSDEGIRNHVYHALASWGDDASRPFLLAQLNTPGIRPSRELLDAVTRLGPADQKCAEAIAAWIHTDRRLAIEGFTALGPVAEKVVIGLVRQERDWGTRNELCRLLTKIGTEASLPVLRDLAENDENGLVKGSAREGVEQIQTRSRASDWLAAAVVDLQSGDHGRCRKALEWLATVKPGRKRPAEVARSLDALLEDRDVFMRSALMRAVAVWGDARTADALVARLRRKELRDWKETLQALCALRGDDRTVEVAIRWLPHDARLVTTCLRTLGPPVEKGLLAAVNSKADGPTRLAACRALGELGSPEAIPQLEAMTGRAGEAEVASEAESALRAIAARR